MASPPKLPATAVTATRLAFLDSDEYLAGGLAFAKTEPFTILCQALEGSYELSIGGRNIRTAPREMWIAPANWPISGIEPGEPKLGKKAKIRWAHVHFQLYDSLDLLSLFELPLKLTPPLAETLGELITDINKSRYRRERAVGLANIGRCQGRAFEILHILCDTSPLKRESVALLNASDILLPVLQFIQRNFRRHVTVSDLAREAHLSVSRFHKLFKAHLKTTPMDYIKGVRLWEACRMLREHDFTVGQIAARTGFCDQFHLSREFKRRFGASPRQYRKNFAIGQP